MYMGLLTTEEVAEELRTTTQTIRRYIREGKIKAKNLGGVWLVHIDDLTNFIDSLPSNIKSIDT